MMLISHFVQAVTVLWSNCTQHTTTHLTTTGTQIYKDIQDRNYSKIIQNEVK